MKTECHTYLQYTFLSFKTSISVIQSQGMFVGQKHVRNCGFTLTIVIKRSFPWVHIHLRTKDLMQEHPRMDPPFYGQFAPFQLQVTRVNPRQSV